MKNLCECIYEIQTTEEQKAFVDSNVESLASLGFVETGDVDDGEVVAKLDI